MWEREEANSWWSDCNARKITMKNSDEKLDFTVIDRAYYWWLFFSYWQFPVGYVSCTDKLSNKCMLNKDIAATEAGDTHFAYINYGFVAYECIPGFFGGKEEIIQTFGKVFTEEETTNAGKNRVEANADAGKYPKDEKIASAVLEAYFKERTG